GHYIDGEKDGHWKRYHYSKEPALLTEGEYSNGIRIGKWKYYRQDGTYVQEFDFDADSISFTNDTIKKSEMIACEKYPGILYVDEPPLLGKSQNDLLSFLGKNINYPATAQENGIQGTVVTRYKIDTEGKLSNIELIKDIGGGCGDEAIRVIKLSDGDWTPAYFNGEPVEIIFTMPVRFALE
ncbi:MAG: energy transducer TonB, partial [Bacteroidetes bacterium]|nr:energy transducer TonB [Bacteroidota bacterium]